VRKVWCAALALVGGGLLPVPAAEPAPGSRVDNPAGLHWRAPAQERRLPDARGVARFVFAVENVSRESVALLAVHVSCPCVSFVLPPLPGRPRVLRPGGTAELQVELDARPTGNVQEETVVVESSLGFSVLRMKVVRDAERREGERPHLESRPQRPD
jgi:hypothetical protein